LDEAAPHCHVLILPLKDGRFKGSELMGNRQTLLNRQANFYETVSQGFGLSKPKSQRLDPQVRESTYKAVLSHLRTKADPCLKSAAWALIRDEIAQNPVKWADCLGIDPDSLAKPREKKLRTMTQIFTHPAKARNVKLKSPIGV
jgi:hypothetical protein